jgi:hypothetical protein
MRNWKGSGMKQLLSNGYFSCVFKDYKQPQKNSSRIASVLAEIQTGNLMNINLEVYCSNSILSYSKCLIVGHDR